MTTPSVRALFTAVTVPGATAPYDTIHAKVHYPARATGSDEERLTGAIPVDVGALPLPVVLVLNGINVGPEAYGWLAQRLAGAGYAVVTFAWVGELFPGQYGLTPGVDVTAVTPDTYGTRPSVTSVRPLLDALATLAAGGALAGALDLDRVALLGHSAGGTMVLQNTSADLFPEIHAGVSVAGHNAAATMLGWEPGTVLPCPGEAPLLLLGGTRDGVIAGSADRYGPDGHDIDPLTRTFEVSVAADRTAYYAVIEGANHFSLGHPEDPTVARGFLDREATADGTTTRAYLGDLVTAFLDRHLRDRPEDQGALDALLDHDLLAISERKPAQ